MNKNFKLAAKQLNDAGLFLNLHPSAKPHAKIYVYNSNHCQDINRVIQSNLTNLLPAIEIHVTSNPEVVVIWVAEK